jgi:hypothetical protein
VLWTGLPPGGSDPHTELRWNHCPSYLTLDGKPKICGPNPVDKTNDCIPDGCQTYYDRLVGHCSGTTCTYCDMSRAGKPRITCDFSSATYPDKAGYFRVETGKCN